LFLLGNHDEFLVDLAKAVDKSKDYMPKYFNVSDYYGLVQKS
jgi:hypothetical protein